ncbi:hypothetical protein G4B88_006543 [Cannabis sativa]|uniref:Uncharacterized protein n=1 Tax=Cannabis sativa TaxID=3483 RepID=A0A7J6H2R0_CANSA|nr:hypothetical protein G4B88_006543 [Cannabis sativa]
MASGQGKVDKTPSKVKTRVADLALPLRTLNKYGAGISSARQQFRWATQKNELGATVSDLRDDVQVRGAGVTYMCLDWMGGIIELTLNRSERRNAIGKDFLRGFKECLEAVSKDSSTNVVLIRSLVPNVFCAGADLKVGNKTQFLELHFDLF